MDPQSHPLLYFLVRMKPAPTNVFLQVTKNVQVTRGEIWAVRTMLKCFPAKSLKRILHQIDSIEVWGRALSCKRMIPFDSIPGRFDFTARRSTLSHQATNHTSLLLLACLQFQCCTNTLNATLTSRTIKKQLCGPVRFHYACLLSYRWQFRYVNKNVASFCEEYVLWRVFGFHWTTPYTVCLLRWESFKVFTLHS